MRYTPNNELKRYKSIFVTNWMTFISFIKVLKFSKLIPIYQFVEFDFVLTKKNSSIKKREKQFKNSHTIQIRRDFL